ncbi:helix-turn-helix domain-containing protein [uncultured Brachyspira sp.]|uniref:helix-turn-helix domain-containing protein n=1 Tax=uncultured Brachyspira sp. TaxID=221953 RepID=UPI0025F78F7D|nr:helix-turn-helix domain-containing protein [uncultured Brachyspira sp.]
MSIITKHIISLSEQEKEKIKEFIKDESKSKRLISRANIILALDEKNKTGLTHTDIAKQYNVTYHTVVNIINEYIKSGLDETLTYKRNPNSNRKKKYTN